MINKRRCAFWLACLIILAVPVWAGGPNAAAALAALSTGEFAILDSQEGIFVVGGQGIRPHPVANFKTFMAVDFTAIRVNGLDTYFVSLLRANKSIPLSRVMRFNSAGKSTG